MTDKVLTGTDALDALSEGAGETTRNEFTYLRSGDEFIVKVPGLNMIAEYVYGSFSKNIYSFIAENPSKKSAKGYPIDNYTPFDLAWKHYKDQSKEWNDKHDTEASHYRCQRKFTIGFYDLDTGKPIMIEFTRNQANAVVETIKQYEKRLDQFAFSLKKTGQGTGTVVSLSLIPIIDDLTDKQQKNFAEMPNDFDAKNFEGLYYVMDEAEQIETLIRSGFDVSLIGLSAPSKDDQEGGSPHDALDEVATADEYDF